MGWAQEKVRSELPGTALQDKLLLENTLALTVTEDTRMTEKLNESLLAGYYLLILAARVLKSQSSRELDCAVNNRDILLIRFSLYSILSMLFELPTVLCILLKDFLFQP